MVVVRHWVGRLNKKWLIGLGFQFWKTKKKFCVQVIVAQWCDGSYALLNCTLKWGKQ